MLFNVTQIPYAIKMSKMVAARLSANTWRMSLLHFIRWQIRAIFHSYTSFKKHSISYTFTEYILWFIHITMLFVKVIKHNLLIASYDFFFFRPAPLPIPWQPGNYVSFLSPHCLSCFMNDLRKARKISKGNFRWVLDEYGYIRQIYPRVFLRVLPR